MPTWVLGVGKSDGRRMLTALVVVAAALAAACGAAPDGVGGAASRSRSARGGSA